MKNNTVKSLSILLSVCMLGTSAVSAAEFSSGPATIETAPAQVEIPDAVNEDTDAANTETQNIQEDTIDPAGTLTDQNSTEKSEEEAFGTGEETFSDEEKNEEFSSEEEIPEAEEEVVAGPVDPTLEARMKDSAVEADIEADPNVKTTCNVYTGNSVEAQDYDMYGHRISSYLTTSPDGGLMRVQAGAIDGKVLVEYYDNSYNIQRTVTVPLALPLFGAFYESGSNYYILTGQNNDSQDDNKEVYRVTKYSKDWKVQGSCSLTSSTKGINTVHPFEDGSARMTMNGNYLYVRTCRTMYAYAVDGRNHQSNLTFSIDTSNMTLADHYGSALGTKYGYVTHSFNQFIQVDNGKLVGLDQGDSHPRALVLLKYPSDLSEGKFAPKSQENGCEEIHFMDFPEGGGNYTGASVGGFEYSDSAYLTAGNYDSGGMYSSRNVFVASVAKSGTTPTVKYFTSYSGEDSASTPYLIKTGSNQFILMWSNRGTVYYTMLDGNGNRVGSTYSMTGNLSDCKPSVINGKLIWYTWHDNANVFYEINLSSLSATRAVKIVNGHQYVYGKVNDGRVTRKCKICNQDLGRVLVPTGIGRVSYKKGNSKRALESGQEFANGQSYEIEWETQHENWSSDLEVLDDCVVSSSDESILSVKQTDENHAVITTKKSGKVTLTIAPKYNPEVALNIDLYIDMHLLNNNGYKITFSPYSFTYNGKEQKPKTVLKILSGGKWQNLQEEKDYTVSYDGDFTNAGTHTATVTGIGSYTGTLKNNFTINRKRLRDGCTVTLAKDSVSYNGKEQKPDFIVKDGDRTLVPDKDYTVTYRNNINVGTATATISGTGNYTSYVTTTFRITLAPTEKPEKPDKPEKSDISKCTVTLSATSFKYDGKEKKPSVTVKNRTKVLTAGTDYTVSYSDNIKAGTAKVVITGKGNYTGSVTKTFKIVEEEKAEDIGKGELVLSQDKFVYDGTEQKPIVTVKISGKELSLNTDYVISFDKNVNAGIAVVTVKGTGKYKGTLTGKFTINPAEIKQAAINLSASSFIYDGKEKKPEITVKNGDKVLIAGTDYTVSYSNNMEVGSAKAVITGKGNYTGSVTKTFEIIKANTGAENISKKRIRFKTAVTSIFGYAQGKEIKPEIVVESGLDELQENVDYTVSYSNNINVGTATITVIGIGKYTGTLTKDFTIRPTTLYSHNTKLSQRVFSYDGTPKKPTLSLKIGTELVEGRDYTATYTDNVNVGVVTVIYQGIGNYTGTLRDTFQIIATGFARAKIKLSKTSLEYDGKEKRPTVSVLWNTRLLQENIDYKVSYSNNINVGTATVTVTGMGEFSGTLTEHFQIVPGKISQKDISGYTVGIGGDTFTYTGSEIKPKVQVSSETETLKEGTDYTVSYKNNIEVGTATAVVKGKGNYTGTLTITFKIVKKSQDDGNKDKISVGKCDFIVMDDEETYDGTAHKPDVIVAWLENKLIEGTDYTLSYSNNVNAGTAKVTITGIGKYTGSVTTSFEIKPASPEIQAKNKTVDMGSGKQNIMENVRTDAKITCISDAPGIVEISGYKFIPKKPGKATIIITTTGEKNYFSMDLVRLTITVRPINTQKLTLKSSARGKMTVSWSTAKSVSGYEIQYSRSKKMKNAQSLTIKGKTTQVTLKNLAKKKKYYVRIRTYKTTNGKKYYSTWSTVKTVKVK